MFYKTLFTINIHHGFFLDSGNVKFLPVQVSDESLSNDEKEAALNKYNINNYLDIIPSVSTVSLFKNFRLLLRNSHEGLSIIASALEDGNKYEPLIFFNETATFTFEIKATDPYFYNYTELADIEENRLYLFSNITPSNQPANFENVLTNNGGPIDNRFLLDAQASQDLIRTISDEEAALGLEQNQYALAYTIELIEGDENLTPQQKTDQIAHVLSEKIKDKKRSGVIGYVRLTIKGDDSNHILEFDESNPAKPKQYLLETTPILTLSFINRKTFWRYISLSNNAKLTTNNKKWSAKNGFIEIKTDDFNANGLEPPTTNPDHYVFPNPRFITVKKEGNDYYSEIYI